jgi:hypothetical protein
LRIQIKGRAAKMAESCFASSLVKQELRTKTLADWQAANWGQAAEAPFRSRDLNQKN